MRKLKYFIPPIVLFASPWTHWLIYNNLLLAWPDLSHDAAHGMGVIGAIAVIFATIIMSLD